MPRNVSFALTTEQIRDRSKSVTRLCGVRIVSIRRERLWDITWSECEREGFPGMNPEAFVEMFCQQMGGSPDQFVTRIEFEYL